MKTHNKEKLFQIPLLRENHRNESAEDSCGHPSRLLDMGIDLYKIRHK